MKIVQINAVCGRGSTGKICSSISRLLTEEGIENYILFSSGSSDVPTGIKYASLNKADIFKSRIAGAWGFEGTSATRRLIEHLNRIQPDIIHLHNLHNHACRLDILFDWIKAHRTKVFWTFHDCWAFTGYCMHFDDCGCQKWKTGCCSCPQKSAFSWFADRSDYLFSKKLAAYRGANLHIITPSFWLAEVFSQSPFAQYPVTVINNGIDLELFQPVHSDILKKYHDAGKYVVFGVADYWNRKKGYDVFVNLANMLNDRFVFLLAGKHEAGTETPINLNLLGRTESQRELAAYYSAADVFVNPTREDTFPTVNIEALACGTPVLTFNVGGSPEIVNESCGCVVEKDDLISMAEQIRRICEGKPYSADACRRRAEKYDARKKYREYIDLYKSAL